MNTTKSNKKNIGFAAYLALIGGIAMATAQWFIFVYAPVESSMGIVQKIFYMHMPLAWWGLLSFFITFAASIAYIKSRNPKWDALAASAAEVGLLMAVLALISGMIWARRSWGVWWTWDARLTTTLIMCFIYAAYLMFHKMNNESGKNSLVPAVIGVIAFLDVPLVFLSARLWQGIHPPSIGMEPEMKVALIWSLLSFAFIWVGILSLRYKISCDESRLRSLVRDKLLHG